MTPLDLVVLASVVLIPIGRQTFPHSEGRLFSINAPETRL